MEIHGGMGYSLEMPVEKYYRDSKLYQVGEGTVNIMRLIIADDALGYKKANRPQTQGTKPVLGHGIGGRRFEIRRTVTLPLVNEDRRKICRAH